MSDQEFSIPKPLVLRVEISAEQAASLAPLLGARTDVEPEPLSAEKRLQPISDYAADARVTGRRKSAGIQGRNARSGSYAVFGDRD